MNNKAIIGACAAAVLVIGYIGASWALGRAVHSGFDTWEQQLAQQPLPMVKVIERKYTPGVFSSVEDVTFEFNNQFFEQLKKARQPVQQEGAVDEASPPMRFTLRNEVKHGPLPGFTRIGMGRIDTTFVWSKEVRAELDKFLPGREPVEISTLLGLLGGTSSHVTSPAFEFKDEKATLGWQGFEGDFSVGRNRGTIGCDATAPGVSVQVADGSMAARFETLKLTCKGERVFDELYNGTVSFEIASLESSAKDRATMRMKKLRYSSDVRNDGEYLDMAMKFGIGAFNFMQYDLSDLKYELSLQHLHGPTYAALMRKIQSTAMSSAGGDPAASLTMVGALAEYGPQLLEHSPRIVIDNIGFSSAEGELGIKGTAELAGFTKDDLATAQSRQALVAKVVANADVWISEALLDKDWSAQAVSAENPQSPSRVEALRQKVAAFEQQGFVTRKDGQLHTHVEFKGGALTANGKPLR